MSPRLALLTLTLVACTGDTAPSPRPATEIAGWAPDASEVTIPLRVQFPAGTPDDERARVVVEASKPVSGEEDYLQRHSLRNMPVFVEVDGAFVSDGEVVHLRLPVEAEFTRARVLATYMGDDPTSLQHAAAEHGVVELRPEPATRVRVVLDEPLPPGGLADHAFSAVASLKRPVNGRRPYSFPIRFDDAGVAVLHGVPRDRDLQLSRGGLPDTTSVRESADAAARYALDGSKLVVEDEWHQTWRVRTAPLVTVEGRVLDEQGRPLERAQLEVSTMPFERPQIGEDGRFTLHVREEQVAGGHVTLWSPQLPPVTARFPDDFEGGVIELDDLRRPEPAETLRGRVLLPDGSPLAGFPLEAGRGYPESSSLPAEMTTEEDGRFRGDLRRAQPVILRGWARVGPEGRVTEQQGEGVAYEVRPVLVEGGQDELDLVARPVQPFEAAVVYDDGTAVDTVDVVAQPKQLPGVGDNLSGGGQLTAQLPVVDGRFTWDRLPPGRWKIFVSASGGARVWQELTLLPDRPRATFRIPRSAVLTGVVLDRDGTPAPTTRVVAESDAGEVEQTDTDERGRFRLEHLAAGAWRVRGHLGSAHRSARTEEQRAVVSLRADEGKGLTLRYPNGPRVSVHVVDGRGRSIKRARIQVTRRDFGCLPDIWPSSQGRATYGPLAPGEYDVVVDRVERSGAGGERFMEPQRRTLSVVAGQDDFELEIAFK